MWISATAFDARMRLRDQISVYKTRVLTGRESGLNNLSISAGSMQNLKRQTKQLSIFTAGSSDLQLLHRTVLEKEMFSAMENRT